MFNFSNLSLGVVLVLAALAHAAPVYNANVTLEESESLLTLPKDPALGLVCESNTGCYWGHICEQGACIKACKVDMDCHHTQSCNLKKGQGKTGVCWWKYNSIHKGQECKAFGDKCWENKQCCSGSCNKRRNECKIQRLRLESVDDDDEDDLY